MRRVAEIHVGIMKESTTNYQPFNILLDALLKFCSKNVTYRTKVMNILLFDKGYLSKVFKNWINDSASVVSMIQSRRWSYFKPTPINSNSSLTTILVGLQNNEQFLIKRREMRLDRFMKLFDKE